MSAVINQMIVLILLLFTGVGLRKAKIADQETNRQLSRLVTTLFQSCMILASVMNIQSDLGGRELLLIFAASLAMYGVMIALSWLVPVLLRSPKEDYGIYKLITIFGNVGFMGFPVVAAIFGSEAVFIAALINIPFNFILYTLGIMLVKGRDKTKFSLKGVFNMTLVASFIALFIFLFQIPIPRQIHQATSLVGNTVVPLGMIIIGISLGGIPLKEAVSGWRVYVFTPLKLLVIPVAVWAVLRLFVHNEVILGVTTILASMPVASLTTMICISYGGNQGLAAKSVFVTTICSVVTIPLIYYILLR